MNRAYVLIRKDPQYRRDAFAAGLRAVGYQVSFDVVGDVGPGDVVLGWNRYGATDKAATMAEKMGATFLCSENGYLGREWNGGRWYALALNRHNGGGRTPTGAPGRWNYPLKPWRKDGNHVLILPQRGIGVAPVAMPPHWAALARRQLVTSRPVVVRAHPGENVPNRSLEADLEGAWACITWGSGAAIKAIVAGIPVFHALTGWIGGAAARPWPGDIEQPFLGDRLPMLEKLAWAQWELGEIADGTAFRALLSAAR